MLLTWNRDLPVIQNARKVVLSISDGERHENIELDPNQVRTGSILYPPISRDVSFQMEVTDGHQTKAISESLRVLDPRPSPLDEPATPPVSAKENAPAKPAAVEPAPTPAEETKAAEEAAVSHPAAPLKPFNSASLAQRLRPASSTDLPEAPVMVRATAPASASLPGIVGTQPALPPPPKQSAASAPTSAAPNANPGLPTGGQLVTAKVISRVDPEYPKLARQAGASGLVELEATISVDGRVKNPRVVRGNAMLQKAAIDAVLQWRYKPAMLNGKPVDSPVEIKLNFVSQGH
jgi:protein TonB